MNPLELIGRYIYDPFFFHPFINLLVAFTKLFLIVKIPWAFGFAIVALTALIRLILHPFFDKQIQTSKKMHDLKPHLDVLSQKHKKDPKKLQAEQMRLYKEAGINPASGCLFVIIQMPIFIALYQTLSLFLTTGNIEKINKVLYFPFLKIQALDPSFFVFNLGVTPAQSGPWYYYLVPLITAVLQYYQTVVTMPAPAKVENKEGEKKVENKGGDFQQAMQTQMKYIFPLMIGWFSYTLPVGLSLYWNIFSIFSIIQYKRVYKK
ncbi:MAG: YidC/Oxa1 family membrane protein insertase [Candidatus Roizmanbacteria bacterium]|nr:MAG: YidC/Oxa1 family membrane protein insertase [Candidatus Roizmanbacteria bacterium]